MASDYTEPLNNIIIHGPEVIQKIREEYNLGNKEDRDKAIAIIEDWIQKQDHFIKKDYSKHYIEHTLLSRNGSIERAKQQIDKLCTVKSLIPKFFQDTNLKESDIMTLLRKFYSGFLPKLTDEYYRVFLIKVKPNQVATELDVTNLFKYLIFVIEYLKEYEYCRGFIFVADVYDSNFTDIVGNINLLELQQFIRVVTECYGCKIKGIYLVTASKLVEGFLNILRSLMTVKLAQRVRAVTSRNLLQNLIKRDILPEIYGGKEKPMEQLQELLTETLSSLPMQQIMKSMNEAAVDESKRQKYDFKDQDNMGMPGTFRTLSLD